MNSGTSASPLKLTMPAASFCFNRNHESPAARIRAQSSFEPQAAAPRYCIDALESQTT